MKSNPKFSLKDRLQSFKYALKGIKLLVFSEHNMWIHISISIAVVILGYYLDLKEGEWALIILCIGMVLAAEAFNTSIEYICDRITKDDDPMIGKIKDISAAAVLITSIMAALVGLLIIVPKII